MLDLVEIIDGNLFGIEKGRFLNLDFYIPFDFEASLRSPEACEKIFKVLTDSRKGFNKFKCLIYKLLRG